jgi:two-component system sensor histidine kinase UhpB
VNTIPLSPEFMRGLREAEATYRHLVGGIPAILYIDAVDELSTNLYTSPQIETILGFSVSEWRDDPSLWIARMHEDDRERVVAEHRRANRTGQTFSTEYRVIARDGREIWFRDEAVLVRNDAGEPLFWRGVMLDVTERRIAEEKLRRSHEILNRTMQERRQLLRRLEEAQEEERRRIAAGIHDDPIQAISGADLHVQALARSVEVPAIGEELDRIHASLAAAVDGLRQLLFELRPPELDQGGLVDALRAYLRANGPAEFSVHDRLGSEPPPEVRAVLFRIAQEALTNVRKHARASRVEITIASEADALSLEIVDDGAGFEPAAPRPGHIGLPSMFERAELLGGTCSVRSAPGSGTVVECRVPMPAG